jgi:hypothetical protein
MVTPKTRQATATGNRRRRAHGPAGGLLWEDVLTGEVGGGAFEDLVLHFKLPIAFPQLGQLTPLEGVK